MFKQKLNWKRPLFYICLPILFVMVFLGFPLPVAPPPATKPAVEHAVIIRKKKKRVGFLTPGAEADDKEAR